MDPALTEDDLTDILLKMNNFNITFNMADNKFLHINLVQGLSNRKPGSLTLKKCFLSTC